MGITLSLTLELEQKYHEERVTNLLYSHHRWVPPTAASPAAAVAV